MDLLIRELFAKNVKELRLSMKLSQEELADKCGLHRTYISDIERGYRNVSIDNIGRIADGLGVKPYVLLEEKKC